MRLLALDHGTKRIGVAPSDELRMIAQPRQFFGLGSFAVAQFSDTARKQPLAPVAAPS